MLIFGNHDASPAAVLERVDFSGRVWAPIDVVNLDAEDNMAPASAKMVSRTRAQIMLADGDAGDHVGLTLAAC